MKKTFLLLAIIFFLLISVFLIVFFLSRRTSFFGRAFNPAPTTDVIANSYLFASPLQAKADGREKIRITIFILSDQGRGISGQPVFLGQNARLKVTAIQSVTDDLGRAIFDVSASSPGEYFIEARAANKLLPQRVRVNFR